MVHERRSRVMRVGGVFVLLVAWATGTSAQEVEVPRDDYLLPLPASERDDRVPRTLPGNTIATPTAYGADFGDLYAGVAYQERTRTAIGDERFAGYSDAAFVVGFGLGDPRELVGLDVALTSYSTVRSPLFEVVYLSFEVHRRLPASFAIAAGWENAVQLGPDPGDGGSSMYGVVSRTFQLRDDPFAPLSAMVASVGVGNGRFRSIDAIINDRDELGVFGSVALRVLPSVGLIANWSGHDLGLGASVAPFRRVPLIVTAGFRDVAGDANDQPRFVLAIGFGYNFEGGLR